MPEPDTVHVWSPIEDLPLDWRAMEETELRALERVWKEQRQRLEQLGALQSFNEQLHRRFAIETGILERLYTLDRGVTLLLIEKGIDAALISPGSTDRSPELVATMIRDHQEAVEGLFSFVRGDRALSTSYVKELHSVLTRHQETSTAINGLGRMVEVALRRGEYKTLPNNPGLPDGTVVHQYCPPEQVASEMDRLIECHRSHLAAGVPPEIEAAWLHHRFTEIHPFQDGNGRVARCLASLVMIRAGWFPVVVTRDEGEKYIDALRTADRGSLQPLVKLFAALERGAFVGALSTADDVARHGQVEQVIAATRRAIEERRQTVEAEWRRALTTANVLHGLAVGRLQAVAAQLQRELESVTEARFRVDVEHAGGMRRHYFRHQIIETARRLGYFADTREHHAWVRLVLRTDSQSDLLVSFHGFQRSFHGVVAVSACLFKREELEEGQKEVVDLTPLSGEVFQVNYAESEQDARSRFERWLDDVLVRGLEVWRRSV